MTGINGGKVLLDFQLLKENLLSVHFNQKVLVSLRQVVIQRIKLLLEKGDLGFQFLAL